MQREHKSDRLGSGGKGGSLAMVGVVVVVVDMFLVAKEEASYSNLAVVDADKEISRGRGDKP